MLGADDLRASARGAGKLPNSPHLPRNVEKGQRICVILRRRRARQATIPSSRPRRSIRQFPRQEIPGRRAGKEWGAKSPGGSVNFRLDGSATRASTAQSQWLLQIGQSADRPTHPDLHASLISGHLIGTVRLCEVKPIVAPTQHPARPCVSRPAVSIPPAACSRGTSQRLIPLSEPPTVTMDGSASSGLPETRGLQMH
jgi:hypothetical protein